MTQGDDSRRNPPISREILRRLPRFAAFASRQPSDPRDNPFETGEMAALNPRSIPERQLAFRLGRAAAHAALRRIGRDEGPITTGHDRAPHWPSGIAGAISHTSDLGIALVAPTQHTDGVGIDVEARRFAPELYDQVLRLEERSWMSLEPTSRRDDIVLAAFSAKESIFKAFYPRVGNFFGFEAASLEPSPAGFVARLVADLDPAYPPERTFNVHCRWHGDLVLTWLVLPGTSHS